MGVKGVVVRAWGVVSLVSLLAASSPSAVSEPEFMDAVKAGNKETVRSLLSELGDVNAPRSDGATALAWAVHRDDLEMAELLIRAGADVNAANEYGMTPLKLACTNRNAAIVEKLLNAKANPAEAGGAGEPPLLTCARGGNAEAVKLLLAHGASVDVREPFRGQTALMWAVAEKHPEVTRVLIEKGADVNAKSNIIEMHKPKFLEYYEADSHIVTAKGGFTPLMFAARTGDLESARILVAAGAKVNEVAPEYGTALGVASASGQEEVALFLLEKGADPNLTDGQGVSPLHWALVEGMSNLFGRGSSSTDRFWLHPNMPELVKALLAHGADPNAKIGKSFLPYNVPVLSRGLGTSLAQVNLAGATPLMLAAATADTNVMRTLVEGRANPKVAMDDGTSILMVAAGVGLEREGRGYGGGMIPAEMEDKLLEALKLAVNLGLDVNAANQDGRTAAHGAAYLGANKILKFLAEQGADLNAEDKYLQTPITIAMGDPAQFVHRAPNGLYDDHFRRPSNIMKQTVELLLELGAEPYTGPEADMTGL